jgi:hypothetical protein
MTFMERKTKNIAKIAEKMGVNIISNASVTFGVWSENYAVLAGPAC